MNVATIEVPKAEAESKLKEYRRRVHKNADGEYARVLRAYEEAAKGKPLLVLSQVMESCPRDTVGRPMLAIARADRTQVKVEVGTNSDVFDVNVQWRSQVKRDARMTVVRPTPQALVDYRASLRARFPDEPWRVGGSVVGYSLVPIVPPDVARGHTLGERFILWEVEGWADAIISAQPDKDPYLLQRIADDLFAVVGEWDLTPLEQAIMRDRAR